MRKGFSGDGAGLDGRAGRAGPWMMLLTRSSAGFDDARPNPPAALWQQTTVLTCASAEFYNGYPWGAAFCTLSPAQPADGSIARPGLANSFTPSRRSGSRSAGYGGLPGAVPRP